MQRGEIYFADLNPTIGSEINKIRPVLIISNNSNNKASDTVTIIPITSNTNKVFPFEVLLESNHTGLPKQSKAQCHQIRTISKRRTQESIAGQVNQHTIEKIEYAIKLHLDLY